MIIVVGIETSLKVIEQFKANRVRKINSISEASEIIRKEEFSVLEGIIADMKDEGSAILDFVKTVRRKSKTLPFYILSNKVSKEQIIQAYDNQITKFVIKSDDPRQAEAQLLKLVTEITYQTKSSRKVDFKETHDNLDKQISEEKEKSQRYLDVAEVMILVINKDGCVEQINRKGCEILEAEEEEIIGYNWFDKWVPETQREQLKEGFERLFKGEVGILSNNENTIITNSNKEKLILWKNNLIRNKNGEIDYVISSGEDISQHQLVSENLAQTYFELEQVFNHSPILMRVIDLDFNVKKANKALLNALNISIYEATNKKCYEIFGGDKCHTEECPIFLIREKNEKEVTYDVKKKIASGREIDCILNARPYYSSRGGLIGIIEAVQDITERKSIELSLKESEEKLRITFENVSDSIQISNDQRIMLYSNPAAERLFGVGKGELNGQKIDDFVSLETLAMIKKQGVVRKEGKASSYEVEIIRRDDQTRKIRVNAAPVFTSEGEYEHSVSIFYDITQDSLEKEREEFLNTLLRHDVKNRIGIIGSYLSILELTSLDEMQEQYVEKAMISLTNADELFDEIHHLLMVGYEEIKNINLKNSIDEAIAIHEDELKSKEIHLEFSVEDISIPAGGLLKELFSNIIENSIKHSNCKKITIKSKEKENQVIVFIEDDGIGIADEKKPLIFETSLSTRHKGGLGLGTLLISKICKSYGGDLRIIESKAGGLAYEITFIK
jgi:PAS domain S-box-containing protein